jgi:hypothetical protein
MHVLCHAPDGPYYVRSTDGGASFSQPLAVVDRQAQRPGLEFTVWDMAVGQDGRVYVALSTNAWKLKLPKEEWGLFYAKIDPEAKAFTEVRNINRTPSEGFSLAVGEGGSVTACWLAGKLYASVSRGGAQTFGPNKEIDPAINPCDCCTTSSAFIADGRLAILYREETNNERDMHLVLWDQGQNRITRTRISTTPWQIDDCPMTYYSIAPQGGGLIAAWPTKGQVYLARIDAEGKVLPPGEIKTPGQSGMRCGVLVLDGAKGHSLVAWKKDNQLGWQRYDAQGKAVGQPGSAKSPGSGAAGAATKDGQFVLFQ